MATSSDLKTGGASCKDRRCSKEQTNHHTSQLSSPRPLRPSFKQILTKLPSLSSSSHNKTPQMGWLKQQKSITYSSGGLAAGPRGWTALAWSGSGEESCLFPASAPTSPWRESGRFSGQKGTSRGLTPLFLGTLLRLFNFSFPLGDPSLSSPALGTTCCGQSSR